MQSTPKTAADDTPTSDRNLQELIKATDAKEMDELFDVAVVKPEEINPVKIVVWTPMMNKNMKKPPAKSDQRKFLDGSWNMGMDYAYSQKQMKSRYNDTSKKSIKQKLNSDLVI